MFRIPLHVVLVTCTSCAVLTEGKVKIVLTHGITFTKHTDCFALQSLGTALILSFLLAYWTLGSAVPSGLFIPCIFILEPSTDGSSPAFLST